MNRGALIARLSCRVHPPVLDALPTDWMRQAVAALDAPRDAAGSAAEYYIAIGRAFQTDMQGAVRTHLRARGRPG